MASQAQREASRRNGGRSKGPDSEIGKAKSSHNATRHGFLTKQLVVSSEDQKLFDELRNALYADLQPLGALEEILVERLVLCAWRLRRLGYTEASLFRYYVFDQQVILARQRVETFKKSTFDDLDLLQDTVITDKGQHAAALEAVEKAVAKRECETLAIAFSSAATETDTLTKLSRYETTNERSFYRALHELQRLQEVRKGGAVAAPAVIDVEVSAPPNRS